MSGEPSAEQRPSNRKGIVLLGIVALCWGLNWTAMKRVLSELPPWSYPAAGLSIAGLCLLLLARMNRQRLALRRDEWLPLAAIALTNFTLWQVLAAHAVGLLPSGRAAILNFTMPVWSIVLGRLVVGERIGSRRLLALMIGGFGVVLLLGGDFDQIKQAPLGVLLMLAAALSWAASVVLMKRFPLTLEPLAFTAWQMLIGGAPIVIGALWLESQAWRPLSPAAWLSFAYSIVMAWIVGYWAWTSAVRALPIAVSSLGTLAIPIVGVLSGVVLLGERPPATDYAALALLGLALAVTLTPAKDRARQSVVRGS